VVVDLCRYFVAMPILRHVCLVTQSQNLSTLHKLLAAHHLQAESGWHVWRKECFPAKYGVRRSMLRVTRQETADGFDLKLEGKLAGRWVDVLQQCWKQALEESAGKAAGVDLSAVTYVDGRGMDLLGQMYRDGASLHGATCMAQGILEDIRSARQGGN
jgi:anti-anti-sigma regulatory factor